MNAFALLLGCLGAAAPAERRSVAALPEAAALLRNLKSSHPRLIAVETDFAAIREVSKSDPVAAGYLKEIRARGEAMLREPVGGMRPADAGMLERARKAQAVITTLGLLHRLDGDPRWAGRAIEEMRACAAFFDWYPYGFLATSEMTAALALGYDWLHDVLPPEDRAAIRAAIAEKGLKASFPFHEKRIRWVVNRFNWNNVCNGGMIVGALAIAGEEPALAEKALSYALKSQRRGLSTYAPDGGWPEGPGYWEYATQYTLFAACALRSAVGTDCGIMDHEGMARTGYFPHAITGPSGGYFNFADSDPSAAPRMDQFGLARWFKDPVLAGIARRQDKVKASAFDLIWFEAGGSPKDLESIPLDNLFRRAESVTLRSSWTDATAVFVGLKAGSNASGHSHLDLGTFVLEANGVRWADELGAEAYSPAYFSRRRFTYYRSSTAGHNTLLIDGENQDPRATGSVTELVHSPDQAFAICDLTAAYSAAGAVKALRGIWLFDGRRRVLVQDEVKLKEPGEVAWSMHTRASTYLDTRKDLVTLAMDGKTLRVRILSPGGARFSVEELKLDPPLLPLEDQRKLVIRFPWKTDDVRIAVLLDPEREMKLPPLAPLQDWGKVARKK